MLAQLAKEAGLPSGVLNIVHGTVDTVNFICDSPTIKAVAFVGSNPAGEHIYKRASATGKRVQANMGAKNHTAILPDASRSHAVSSVVGAAFGAAGQRCMALSVAVLVGGAKEWLPDIVEAAKQLKVGSGFEPETAVGPMITPAAVQRAERLIQEAVDEGATVLLDGRGVKVDGFESGNFLGPTVVTGVTPSMAIYKEEVFGPVLCVMVAASLDESIELINANECGRPRHRTFLEPFCSRPVSEMPCSLNGSQVRQRHEHLHLLGPPCALLPAPRRAGAGGDQRGHPGGAAVLLLLGRQEELLGRPQHVRQDGGGLLHARADRHRRVARARRGGHRHLHARPEVRLRSGQRTGGPQRSPHSQPGVGAKRSPSRGEKKGLARAAL